MQQSRLNTWLSFGSASPSKVAQFSVGVNIDGLMEDATRPGRPRTARAALNVQEIVRITLEETPKGATHWSTCTLAAHLGTNATAVARIWRAHGLT